MKIRHIQLLQNILMALVVNQCPATPGVAAPGSAAIPDASAPLHAPTAAIPGHAAPSPVPAVETQPDFLDDVSLWHSEVRLHEDRTRYDGRYIDGVVIGNGSMLVVEGMTTDITRFEKSRVTDSRLHGSFRFETSANGVIEHLSRSRKVPLHALQWAAGPVYTEVPFIFGCEFGVEYRHHGSMRVIDPDTWNHERQYRIRHTNIVKNILESEDLAVTAIDFMPPDTPGFIRWITVVNTSDSVIDSCRFTVTFRIDPRNWTGTVSRQPRPGGGPMAVAAKGGNELDFYMQQVRCDPDIEGKRIERAVLIEVPQSRDDLQRRLMVIHAPESFGTASKSFLEYHLGRLEPGGQRTFRVLMATAFNEGELSRTLEDIAAGPVTNLLRETYKFWTTKLAAADKRALPLRRNLAPAITDYIDSVRLLLLSLQTRDGGCIAHPYSYNAVYFRDDYDIFRALLALGHQADCREHIQFFQKAMHRIGIAMCYAPAWFASVPDTARSRIDEVRTLGHFLKSEYMLFFPMMVRDYTERFSEDDFARSLYPEMKRALESQPVDAEGLIAYSGDEISVKLGKPLYRYSPQNAVLYVQAAEFVARIAGQLGHAADSTVFARNAERVRAATERRFWNEPGYYAYSADDSGRVDPRINVFAQALPFFYGYLRPDNTRLRLIIDNVKRENMFPSHRVATLPIAGKKACGNNGNTIGLLLYMMSLANDPEAQAVFDRMAADAGTMGSSGEYLVVSNDAITHGEMLRPYESAFNLCAALEFLRSR